MKKISGRKLRDLSKRLNESGFTVMQFAEKHKMSKATIWRIYTLKSKSIRFDTYRDIDDALRGATHSSKTKKIKKVYCKSKASYKDIVIGNVLHTIEIICNAVFWTFLIIYMLTAIKESGLISYVWWFYVVWLISGLGCIFTVDKKTFLGLRGKK